MLNLEYWVSELPESITFIPIIELAIPGTYYKFNFNVKRLRWPIYILFVLYTFFTCKIDYLHNYILGSHDSFSYTITPHSKLGPDASRLVKCLNRVLGPVMRKFVYKWSITQTCNIQCQLCLGIR